MDGVAEDSTGEYRLCSIVVLAAWSAAVRPRCSAVCCVSGACHQDACCYLPRCVLPLCKLLCSAPALTAVRAAAAPQNKEAAKGCCWFLEGDLLRCMLCLCTLLYTGPALTAATAHSAAVAAAAIAATCQPLVVILVAWPCISMSHGCQQLLKHALYNMQCTACACQQHGLHAHALLDLVPAARCAVALLCISAEL